MATNTGVSTCFSSVSCTVCSSPFSDPRLLPCLHVFCKSCLDPLYSQNEEGTLACPTCYTINTCPSPSQLPRHLRIEREVTQSKLHQQTQENEVICQSCDDNRQAEAYCEDCVSPLCSHCLDAHKLLKITRNHCIVDINQFPSCDKLIFCNFHPNESVKYYCCECCCLACSECLYSHKKHNWYSVDDADIQKRKSDDIKSMLPQVETAMVPISKTIRSVDDIMNVIREKDNRAKATINAACDQIASAVEQKRRELINQIESMSLAKLTCLQMQKEDLEKIIASHQVVLDVGQDAIANCDSTELLSIEGSLLKASNQYLVDSHSYNTQPVCNSSLNVLIDASKIIDPLISLGDVVTSFSSHCTVANINPELPIGIGKGLKYTLTLESRDEKGRELTVGGMSIQGKVVDNSSETLQECEVKDLQNGHYEISFDNPVEGRFQVCITVDGVGIDSNPLTINVRDYSSIKNKTISVFSNLLGMAFSVVGPDSLIYATSNTSIIVCSKERKLIRKIDSSKFTDSPHTKTILKGITISNGVIFVACSQTRQIFKITLDGDFIMSKVLNFLPSGLCLTIKGLLLVGDRTNNSIQILDSDDLSFIRLIPCLSRVYGVTVDGVGNIHAACRDRVKVFTISGEKITEYGQGVLTNARGIAVLKESPYSFVTDYAGWVHVFDWSNNTVINSFEAGKAHPYGISVNQEGMVIVSASHSMIWF